MDPRRHVLGVEVRGGSLPDRVLAGHPREERLVPLEGRRPHLGLEPCDVTRPAVRDLGLAFGLEEVRLPVRAHVQVGVLAQIVAEGLRAGLRRPDDEEVGHGHRRRSSEGRFDELNLGSQHEQSAAPVTSTVAIAPCPRHGARGQLRAR